MKLQIVSAARGAHWVRLGIKTFFKQPLAMAGLFFMFMASMSLLSLLPVVGNILALMALPAATMGFMVATQQVTEGRFPRPSVLLVALRGDKTCTTAMVKLGALYAAGFLLVLALSAIADGGKFARIYMGGGGLSQEVVQSADFLLAVLLAMALYAPLSLLFWHAPALVYWHGIAPTKSLFFSMVACMRNFWAFTVFGVVWFGVFLAVGLVVALTAEALNNPEVVGVVMLPGGLILAAMFFTSLFFTYEDCFTLEQESAP